eukprot:CAMPEP_0170552108 /NCGR_PEP_ID=MMETSP0211-20121228/10063_1 /TAXON_ID=311385 /ORGANISM="Pseudokeronopsis sp., Strain OXSARD2" /LENGTH=57 /DNA_ID=CAMNT_0010859665 /DNA_START=2133 /DNA_END=2306 /DNA_ORIENTATION=-
MTKVKKIEDLEEQVKGLQQYEFKFEQERLDKTEIRNELQVAIEKNEKLKNTIERTNN